MAFQIRLRGGPEIRNALKVLLESHHGTRGLIRNFRTLRRFALSEVKRRTPGSGSLRAAWQAKTEVRQSPLSLRAMITNRKAERGVFYEGVDGVRRRKLKADDQQLKWREVIHMLDVGTKAHEIRPRRRQFLAFKVKGKQFNPATRSFAQTEDVVFTKHVSHPGTKAYGMLTETTNTLRKMMTNIRDRHRKRVIRAWTDAQRAGGRVR